MGLLITDVEAIGIRAPDLAGGQQPPWSSEWWSSSPLDIFRGAKAPSVAPPARMVSSPTDPVSGVAVRVLAEGGLEGISFVSLGGSSAVDVITHHLKPIVLGRNAFDVELLWDMMFRSTINIGRRGLVLGAISGIDIALWDLMGKSVGHPVYDLLGGRTRDAIRAYASRAYATADPARVAEEAKSYVADGYTAVKMRFGYGPVDGPRGMRANYELVRAVRDAVGPDVELMADAYMGWDAVYATRMINMIEEFSLAFVEEPVPPDDVDGYARIRASVRTPIAGGEHESTRWGLKQLIDHKAVDIIQLDVNRVGGITEARKIWALAASHGMTVIPHGQNFHNAHLVMANMNSPLIEVFPPAHIDANTLISHVVAGDPTARDGYVTLSDSPGFGVHLDQEVLRDLRV